MTTIMLWAYLGGSGDMLTQKFGNVDSLRVFLRNSGSNVWANLVAIIRLTLRITMSQ